MSKTPRGEGGAVTASEYGVLMLSRLESRAIASDRDDLIDAARMQRLAGSME